jgi:hypothetical protein
MSADTLRITEKQRNEGDTVAYEITDPRTNESISLSVNDKTRGVGAQIGSKELTEQQAAAIHRIAKEAFSSGIKRLGASGDLEVEVTATIRGELQKATQIEL